MRIRLFDMLTTAMAPAIWGSTYIVTTELLPNYSPLTLAMLRALPAGLLLPLIVRQLPTGIWWRRIFILGALNFSIFWGMLLVSVYRLPGGVALLVLTPNAALDAVGVVAGLAGAVSMAFGIVLTRTWQPQAPLLVFTAWQLTVGGLLLVPVVLLFEASIPVPTGANLFGLAWLGLIGAALTYLLWFRGIARLESAMVSLLGFLSPATAVLLGWGFLNQTRTPLQVVGFCLVIGSISQPGVFRSSKRTTNILEK